ncbi:hypothetical protein ASPCAL10551 [Aspergillus calidoustus]|uniref:Coenzyme Q-binding protein COQ10 START domain-containing protein n=1 Tax=Aspergillus calidoustus TaxID=454130 RepID=A0A0U5G5M0_ASPCI|nr:hypothetical protein ASPCAL10551 [Aspergillus calidoustus]
MPDEHPNTPNIPSTSAVLRIQSSTVIHGPIDQVWAALTDTSTWPSWNKFVPRVTIREQPENTEDDSPTLSLGSRFTFHVNMYPEPETPADAATAKQLGNVNLRDTYLKVIECEAPTSASASTSTPSQGRKARIVWASDGAADGLIMSSLLTAERVHELVEVQVEGEEGKVVTEVRNWESQVGYLAYVVRWMFEGRLRENFGIWESGLKGYVEGRK